MFIFISIRISRTSKGQQQNLYPIQRRWNVQCRCVNLVSLR
jgi:hypothetical protein